MMLTGISIFALLWQTVKVMPLARNGEVPFHSLGCMEAAWQISSYMMLCETTISRKTRAFSAALALAMTMIQRSMCFQSGFYIISGCGIRGSL
jgi:hypothetical protein